MCSPRSPFRHPLLASLATPFQLREQAVVEVPVDVVVILVAVSGGSSNSPSFLLCPACRIAC